ncbi:MAG TPA: zinc dependent phospholipase C family protein [Bryobacteraceae bacterium]|nr:zinc dependent phospholipase C family protein [Bryobacteraceae bacterium]
MSNISKLVLILACLASGARANAPLAHEALIDSAWPKDIKPLLLQRFPGSSEEALTTARGYAYGGSIIQDMGYYPFGSRFFTDLVHYARSGDFVLALLRDAQDINELAFALGALAHYTADNIGHPGVINRSVPMLYPKLQAKYGNEVTYEDNPSAHLKTEFGFDVVQVARGQYASKNYHDFVGFDVSLPLLERAFHETYYLQLQDLIHNTDRAIGTYRLTVSKLIPTATDAAWRAKKKDIQKLDANMTQKKFIYRLSRRDFRKQWKQPYQEPSFAVRFLEVVYHIIPKVGPFRALGFKVPTPDAEKLFLVGFDGTLQHYRAYIHDFGGNSLSLPNENFDTGRPTKLGDYRMADNAYQELLERLGDPSQIPPDLRANIVDFYRGSAGPTSEKALVAYRALIK